MVPSATEAAAVSPGGEPPADPPSRDDGLGPGSWRRIAATEQLAAVGELAGTVARGIGTPLTAIQVTVDQLLARECRGNPEAEEALRRILDQTRRIALLARQLVDLAEPGTPRPEPIGLNLLVGEVVDLLGRSFREAGVEVALAATEEPLVAVVDRNQLRQVLVQLLLNARVVLSGWSGPRRIRVSCARGPEGVQIQVADSGPGVPEADAARIFFPFVSLQGGTGLGLSMVRHILQRQGGEIEVARNDWGGATFTVTLPEATDA